MDDTVREELQGIVQEIYGAPRVISDVTRLYHDLWIAGDDAAELLNKVHNRFGTRFDGFHFETYFPNETDAMIEHVARLFGYSRRRKGFSFGHLLQVVNAGRWFDPENVGASA